MDVYVNISLIIVLVSVSSHQCCYSSSIEFEIPFNSLHQASSHINTSFSFSLSLSLSFSPHSYPSPLVSFPRAIFVASLVKTVSGLDGGLEPWISTP